MTPTDDEKSREQLLAELKELRAEVSSLRGAESGGVAGAAPTPETSAHRAEPRALEDYERLLDRLTHLAESLGTARDHLTLFRDLGEFACASVPSIGIFISLYDPERDVRTAQYAWGEGEEVDVSQLPPMPVTREGPNSRAIRTGQVVITDDYMNTQRGHPSVLVGQDNGLRPQSSLVVPMSTLGRVVGTVEVQSYERGAYRDEHVTAMRLAANLAAVAIENMRLLGHESRARAMAEEANCLKDEFLATLSHELRTPLTAILGWAGMLRAGQLDAVAAQTAFEIVERNARAQQRIVDDILDVSRVIRGQLRFDPQPLDVRPVIESAVDIVRPAADAKNIRLETHPDPRVGHVYGDAGRLQQVAWNLLSNAVKFTPAGGRVRVSIGPAGSHVRLTVEDTGAGIRPEFLPYVFDRFRQGDQSTTRRHGGLGLGLSIVRHLVELHGGTVSAESAGEGQGSTFVVELPASGPRAEASGVAGRASAVSETPAAGDRPPALTGLRVLVVDDEPDTLELIRLILEQSGAEVTAVTSAGEALEVLPRLRPDVLLSDIGMPGEDGYVLLRKVRALGPEQGGAVPAVALTAYAGEADRALSLSAGFQLHVPKPIDPSELIEVITDLVGSDQKFDRA